MQALRTLDAAGEPVTFETVAKQAGVSRSWLYAQPDLRAEIERLRAAHRREPRSPVPARQRTSDASLLRRLEAANARIRRLTEENQQTPRATRPCSRRTTRRDHPYRLTTGRRKQPCRRSPSSPPPASASPPTRSS
ncbi:DUF6262 family protein [Streptomyces sp. NPDC087844]|uniref:DUF6262 family protein n=1 Tax=Streptomyces sp. NPDC087844 TaxID=3365805 RepID=UPI003806DA50